jgi:hypothetical protein
MMFSRAFCRVVCSRENGFGRRLTSRGSTLPGLLPTRIWAINLNRPAVSSGTLERNCRCLQAIQTCSVCLKLNCRGNTPAFTAAWAISNRIKL